MSAKRKSVTLLFKSGRSVDITCTKYEFSYNTDSLQYCGYKLDDCRPEINFNPFELEGYIVK